MSGRINPYRLFNGAFVPNWLLERGEVSPGAKLLYARLCQFAGRDGHCFPKQETLAASIGVAERQVRNLAAELKEHGLIETEQPGLRRPLYYFFLRHPWMSAPGPEGAPEDFGPEETPGQERQFIAGQERKENAGQERQLFAGPLLNEENQGKRINGKALARAEEVEDFVRAWNSLPQDFPKIKLMSSGRARALAQRLKEPGWREAWKPALERMPSCPFLAGKNERGWKADVDFFLRPDSAAKILEGKYDGPAPEVKKDEPFWRKHL